MGRIQLQSLSVGAVIPLFGHPPHKVLKSRANLVTKQFRKDSQYKRDGTN